jgi:two-component system cell cycle response regulator DivK
VPSEIVLIVEDNEQNMELASFLLEEAGFEVRRAAGPEEARTQIELLPPPALVLMDMNLAGSDGMALVAEFRKLPHGRVPIVALTAHAMRGDRERFLAGGCDGYISKPISTRTFLLDVRKYLEGQATP